jgi:subtilase family serine protease
MSKSSLRPVLGAALAVTMIGAVFATAAAASPGRTLVTGSTPSWASPATFVRHTAGSTSVTVHVVLGWRNATQLDRLKAAVSTPGTKQYRHFLTGAQFRARFSPSAADAAKVGSWLRSQGLRLGRSPKSRLWVEATGSASQVEKAFGVTLNDYRHLSHITRAPSADPTVPSSLAGIVRGVTGLADIQARINDPGDAPPPPAFVVGKPCSDFWGEVKADDKPKAYGEKHDYTVCGYSPQQMQGAYEVDQLIKDGTDGSGQAVAVVDAFNNPTAAKDLKKYSKNHKLPAPNLEQHNVQPPPGNDALKQGWYGEEALDLDAVHAMAPKAKIVYEGARSSGSGDLLGRITDVLDNDRANIITNSYGFAGEGLPQSEIDKEEAVYSEAVAQGVGIYFSTGDCGDNTDPDGLCGGSGQVEPDYPSSSPNVTAVGGTSLAVDSDNGYLFETGWGTALSNLQGNKWVPDPPGQWLYGGGGGISGLFKQPSYQKGIVPKSLANGKRVVPDISADGDPNTGFTIGITQTFSNGDVKYGEYRIGGTSLSSPLMAGIMALADQAAGGPLGFINPAIYKVAKSDKAAYNDIVDPAGIVAVVRTNYVNNEDDSDGLAFSLRTMNQTLSLKAKKGYDDITGIGTPVTTKLIPDLAAL